MGAVFVFFSTRTTGQISVKFGIGGSVMKHTGLKVCWCRSLEIEIELYC